MLLRLSANIGGRISKRILFNQNVCTLYNLRVPEEPIHFGFDLYPDDKDILSKLIKDRQVRWDLDETTYIKILKMHKNQLKLPPAWAPLNYEILPPERNCVRHLSYRKQKKGGRCKFTGKIVSRFIGGGFARRIRIVDYKRDCKDPQKILRIERDPNRTAKLALVRNVNTRELTYIIAADGMEVGQILSNDGHGYLGNALKLKNIPDGTTIHGIESAPGRGARLLKAAGTRGIVKSRDSDGKYVYVELPSSLVKKFSAECKAVIGIADNPLWHKQHIGSAGRNRRLGVRPRVRGVAMNAVDHPNGGGRDRTKGGILKSKWGRVVK